MKCMRCGFESHSTPMVIVYDPLRPKGSRKKDHIIGYHCDKKECEPSLYDKIPCENLSGK